VWGYAGDVEYGNGYSAIAKSQAAPSNWEAFLADWSDASVLAARAITVATIDGDRPRGDAEERFLWETVHRWVHCMIEKQQLATSRRYSPDRRSEWRPRRRRPQRRG
jgi:hypothetical protein